MKKIFTVVMTSILSLSLLGSPAMAASQSTIFGDTVDAAILKGCAGKEGGKGESITCILELVVDIMTIGVGILGVIGISITGIQYLTAGGREEKTRKAKRRMFEIVIGLVAYVLIYAALKWLLPSFGS